MFIQKFNSKEKKILGLALFTVLDFVVLTTIATFFYPGGYDYLNHYFSNLGRVLVGGTPNTIASALFMISLFSTSVLILPFWYLMANQFSKTTIEKMLSIVASSLAVLSSFFLAGVAYFPSDLATDQHVLYARLFFFGFGIVILLYSIVFILNSEFDNIVGYVGFVIFLLSIILAQGFPGTIGIGPLWQKVVVYCYILWVAFVSNFLWKKVP